MKGDFNMARTSTINTTANRARFSIAAGCSKGCYLVKRYLRLCRERGLKIMLFSAVQRVAVLWLACLVRISLLKTRKGYVVKEILGSKMYLDYADKGVSRQLIIDGTRETLSIEIVRRELKKGDIVVEVGANIGYYALFESQLIGEKGRIYAIEPVSSNLELLRKNIELNGYSNIDLYPFAIGESNGIHSMYLTTWRNKPSLRDITGTRKEKHFTEEIKVEVMAFDDFIKDKSYPNFVRMDVEGYEYHIIRGMKDTLQRKLPLTLLIEFHFHLMTRQESTEILDTLRSAGFRIVDVVSEAPPFGIHRHKLLSKIIYSTESVIEKKLSNRKPLARHLDMSFDDILSDPVILDGKLGALHICFKRD